MTDIEEIAQNTPPLALDLYPNPTKTMLAIRTCTPLRDIKVYDIVGNLVRAEIMVKPVNTGEVSVKGLSAGVYFVKINAEGTEAIEKVVVMK